MTSINFTSLGLQIPIYINSMLFDVRKKNSIYIVYFVLKLVREFLLIFSEIQLIGYFISRPTPSFVYSAYKNESQTKNYRELDPLL